MAMSKREYRQAVRKCQELDAMGFLPICGGHKSNISAPEDESVDGARNICCRDDTVDPFGDCCDCYAAAALIF